MKLPYFNKENKFVQLSACLLSAGIGGVIFSFFHIPLPWLLGPMTAVLAGSKSMKIQFYWPTGIRSTGLIIIGYSIGLSFTKDALVQIINQLPSMLFMTIILIAFCAFLAVLVSKFTGVDYPTVLTGSIPGGLTQMVTLAEEMEGINLTTVTFLQVARLMMIIFFIPLLVFSPLFAAGKPDYTSNIVHAASSHWDVLSPGIILFAIVSIICAKLGEKIKLPTPYLIGPILGTAVLNVSGFQGQVLPPVILGFAQFSMGCYFGLLLKPEELKNKVKIISFAIIYGIVLILGSWGLSYALTIIYSTSTATSFLCLAPGGMEQMGIIANEINADVYMVTGYQLFRMFFVNFAVPPLLKLFFKYSMKIQM